MLDNLQSSKTINHQYRLHKQILSRLVSNKFWFLSCCVFCSSLTDKDSSQLSLTQHVWPMEKVLLLELSFSTSNLSAPDTFTDESHCQIVLICFLLIKKSKLYTTKLNLKKSFVSIWIFYSILE